MRKVLPLLFILIFFYEEPMIIRSQEFESSIYWPKFDWTPINPVDPVDRLDQIPYHPKFVVVKKRKPDKLKISWKDLSQSSRLKRQKIEPNLDIKEVPLIQSIDSTNSESTTASEFPNFPLIQNIDPTNPGFTNPESTDSGFPFFPVIQNIDPTKPGFTVTESTNPGFTVIVGIEESTPIQNDLNLISEITSGIKGSEYQWCQKW